MIRRTILGEDKKIIVTASMVNFAMLNLLKKTIKDKRRDWPSYRDSVDISIPCPPTDKSYVNMEPQII